MTRRAGDSGPGRKPQRRPSRSRRLGRETGGAAAAVETRPRAFGADEARRATRAARRARAGARATRATGARRPLRDGRLNPPREREPHGRMRRCLGALGPSPLSAAESSGSSRKAPRPSRRLLPPPPLVTARCPSSVSPLDDGRSGEGGAAARLPCVCENGLKGGIQVAAQAAEAGRPRRWSVKSCDWRYAGGSEAGLNISPTVKSASTRMLRCKLTRATGWCHIRN